MTWEGMGTLDPGTYALEDHNSAEFLWATRGFGDATLTHVPYSLPAPPEPGMNILVCRVGGFGDTIWLNAIYEHLHVDITIDHACFHRYSPVVVPRVRHKIEYPFTVDLLPKYDAVYWLENIIEGAPCLKGEHPTERIGKVFGVTDLRFKNAVHVTPSAREWASKTFPRIEKLRVMVQDESSTPSKSYIHMPSLCKMLIAKGYQVVVIGRPRKIEGIPRDVIDGRNLGWTINESIAMAETCDAIIAPDSFMVHVADALQKPCIGLYGNFDGATYMKGYLGEPVQGAMKCSPCSWHPRGKPFPPDCPSADRNFCMALAKRNPELIITILERYL